MALLTCTCCLCPWVPGQPTGTWTGRTRPAAVDTALSQARCAPGHARGRVGGGTVAPAPTTGRPASAAAGPTDTHTWCRGHAAGLSGTTAGRPALDCGSAGCGSGGYKDESERPGAIPPADKASRDRKAFVQTPAGQREERYAGGYSAAAIVNTRAGAPPASGT